MNINYDELSNNSWTILNNIFSIKEINLINQWIQEKELTKASMVNLTDKSYRGDFTRWIENSDDPIESLIFNRLDNIRIELNKNLYLGLKNFEAHIAHYPIGAKYGRHFDSTIKNNKRVISLVTYLNPEWEVIDGGQLNLYLHDEIIEILPITPYSVMFVSKDVEHEVLTTNKDRYSIATWFTQD